MWFPLRKLYVLCFCVNEVGLCIFIKHTILYYVPCSCIIIISLRFPLPFFEMLAAVWLLTTIGCSGEFLGEHCQQKWLRKSLGEKLFQMEIRLYLKINRMK